MRVSPCNQGGRSRRWDSASHLQGLFLGLRRFAGVARNPPASFLSARTELTLNEALFLATVDYNERRGIVAALSGQGDEQTIAVGRYDGPSPLDPGYVEFSIVAQGYKETATVAGL